jgi:hypothetical protein
MILKFFKRVLIAVAAIMALIVIVDTLLPPPAAAAVFAVIAVGLLALSLALRIAYKRWHPERAPARATSEELIANLHEARLLLMWAMSAITWITLTFVLITVRIAGGPLREPWGPFAFAFWLAPLLVGDLVLIRLRQARHRRRPDLFPTFPEEVIDWPASWVWNRQSPRASFHRAMQLVRERP